MDTKGNAEDDKAELTAEPATIRGDADVPSQPLDPNDSARLIDQIRGQTKEHAIPPRLEDEGQSGG
ncbi:MAG TPA: hypothetical protein VH325_09085 [Bryobacteraceae bacterium]|jgi:hypothetical protein|nr:hypothetical protein [Bryobacteraceae bacterium]